MIPASSDTIEFAVLIAFLAFFSVVVYRRKSLDTEGILVADMLGLLTYLLGKDTSVGGLGAFATLLVFFFVGEAATRIVKKKKSHEVRSTRNVVMNSAGGLLALLLQSPAGFFGAIAAVTSDTVSSEIGPLDKHKPWLITNFKPVNHGMDGAISPMGLLAGIGSAALLGAFCFLLLHNKKMALATLVAGVIGNLVDSLAGAVLQKHEAISNAEVNLICGISGGIAGALIFAWL